MTSTRTHKGGRPTPMMAGLNLAHRDAIWERLQGLEEGTLFRPFDLLEGLPDEATRDFHQALGYDHLHVNDGWHTAILETPNVRIPPNPVKVVQEWCRSHGWGEPAEFGDWIAWKEGLYPWEPLAGYRFRVIQPGADCVLALGYMRVRIQDGGAWLLDTSEAGKLLRALTDMPRKTLRVELHRWIGGQKPRRDRIQEVVSRLDNLDEAWEASTALAKGDRPSEIAKQIRTALE